MMGVLPPMCGPAPGSGSAAARPPGGRRIARSFRVGGLALVLVLWMIAALLVTVTGVVYAVRGDVRAVSMAREMAAAGALGDAGVVLAARTLAESKQPEARWQQTDLTFDGTYVEVRVIPLAGMIDVNAASEALLTELIAVGGGVDRTQAAVLAQRIIDWRDADEQPQPQGAENAAYAAAGSPFRTRGGPFETTEDLLQVLGIDFDLYEKLRPLVTVHARGDGRVDPAAAPLPVLRVLAAGNDQVASAYAAAREASGALADTTRFPAAFITRGQAGSRYLIEASVQLSNGAVQVTRKVLELEGAQQGLPWQTLWAERAVVAELGD